MRVLVFACVVVLACSQPAPAPVPKPVTPMVDADTGPGYVQLAGHTEVVVDVAFSPDGQWIATASHDGSIKVWGLDGNAVETRPLYQRLAAHVAWSRDGTRLLAGSSGHEYGPAKLIQLADDAVVELPQGAAATSAIAFSPDGHLIAIATEDRQLLLWDVAGTRIAAEHHARGPKPIVWDVAFSPDGKRLASAGEDGLRVWAVWAKGLKPVGFAAAPRLRAIKWRDDKTLGGGSLEGRTLVFTIGRAGVTGKELGNQVSFVTAVGWTDTGQLLALARDGITVWDVAQGTKVGVLHADEPYAELQDMAVSRDGKLAIACGQKRSWLWRTDGTASRLLPDNPDDLNGCRRAAWSRDGQRFAITVDSAVRVYALGDPWFAGMR